MYLKGITSLFFIDITKSIFHLQKIKELLVFNSYTMNKLAEKGNSFTVILYFHIEIIEIFIMSATFTQSVFIIRHMVLKIYITRCGIPFLLT